MDFTNPLATVTPTLDAAVLQALSATTSSATGAHLHRMAGRGSADGVRRVLARLVAQGVVLAEDHANAVLYRLNRDHLAVGHILGLTRLRGAVLDRLRAAIDSWDPAPTHASLFGSFARGEASAESDIDLLLVPPRDLASTGPPGVPPAVAARWDAQIDGLAVDIERWTGNRAHLLDVDHERLGEMLEAADPLVESWRAEHVHLSGTRLLDLLRSVRLERGLPLKGLW
jgi:hypothetical protein